MKKIFALLFALVASFGLLTSCELNQKTPTEPVEPTEPTVEEISQDLKNAKNYVKNIYQATEGKVTANMDRAAKVPVGTSKSAKVDWAVEVTSGDANAVSVQKAEDGSKWVVNVKYDNTITAEVKFVLTATITLEDGESTTISFNYTIPVFEANTIAEMIKEADKEKIYFLEGVITAVNKTEGNTAFIITDATGSIFCYDGLEVKLGQKVQITGNYSAYNDAFHQLAKPALVKVLAENQDLATVCGTPLVTTAQAINEAAKAEGATAVSLTEAYGGKFLEVTGYVVNANGYANLAVAADVASCCNLYANDDLNLKSFIGAKVVVKGYARGVSVGNGITIQLQSVELAPGESMPTPPAAEIEEPAVTNKTLAEIIAMDDANNLKAAYKVTTTVYKLGQKEEDTAAGIFGNLWVGTADSNILVYGATATSTALTWDKTTGTYSYANPKDFESNELTKGIKVGDTLELLVVRSAYKGTPQLMAIVLKVNENTPVVNVPFDTETEYAFGFNNGTSTYYITGEMSGTYGATTTTATEAGKVKVEAATDGYYLTVTVGTAKKYINLVEGTNSKGNATVYVSIDATASTVYTWNAEYATFTAPMLDTDYYMGTYSTFTTLSASKLSYAATSYPSHLYKDGAALGVKVEEDTPTEEAPEVDVTATISFADVANRTEQTTEKQVWVQNGITVTNDKAASTSNVADYKNPARFYKSSDLKIEYTSNVTTIIVNCNTEGYATALAASTITGGTAVANGKVVTITLTTPATSIAITSLSAQVRVDSISVVAAE